MKISDIFQSRAKGVTASLTPMHHDVMDVLFTAKLASFNLDDALNLVVQDGSIFRYTTIAENHSRIKLVVIRSLDGLTKTNLIRKTSENDERFEWTLT